MCRSSDVGVWVINTTNSHAHSHGLLSDERHGGGGGGGGQSVFNLRLSIRNRFALKDACVCVCLCVGVAVRCWHIAVCVCCLGVCVPTRLCLLRRFRSSVTQAPYTHSHILTHNRHRHHASTTYNSAQQDKECSRNSKTQRLWVRSGFYLISGGLVAVVVVAGAQYNQQTSGMRTRLCLRCVFVVFQ